MKNKKTAIIFAIILLLIPGISAYGSIYRNNCCKKNKQVYPVHGPYGKGTGAKPGRVVWSHNPESVNWNGKGCKFYWKK